MSATPARARQLAAALLPIWAATFYCPAAGAYEADVHYGLTEWLARQAGFEESQARAIAVGNQRLDSGLVDTMELNIEHACVGRFESAARDVQQRHFPAATAIPVAPDERVVIAGGPAARKPLTDLLAITRGKEGLLLSRLGEALHTLQDSWSHAGVPGVLAPASGLGCDAAVASGHPASRGGPRSHAADLTYRYPNDALAMAQAVYTALLSYPPIHSQARRPVAWPAVASQVTDFIRARTKTEKRDWFVTNGGTGTEFLEGITLPDGPRPGALGFTGRKLPTLNAAPSPQWDAPADARAFFDMLINRWLGPEPVAGVVTVLAGGGRRVQATDTKPPVLKESAGRNSDVSLEELKARMTLWKLKDHGAAADLAHAPSPLTRAQQQTVQRLSADPAAFVSGTAVDALFPVIAKSAQATPLLPYIVRSLPDAPDGSVRIIAIARLRHAPYDTIGWIAQRAQSGWVLAAMVSAPDQ